MPRRPPSPFSQLDAFFRTVGRRFGAMFLAAFLAAAALPSIAAEPADSVALFTALAKPALLPNRIEWREARATGPSSLVLSEVVLRLAPNPLWPEGYPIRIARATIEDIDFESLRQRLAPLRLRLRLDGISASAAALGLQHLGQAPLRGSALLDYRAEPGKGVRVQHLSLELASLGRLDTALDLGGSGARSGRLNVDTFDTLTLRSGWLSYEDASLLRKLVAAEAERRHVKEGTVVAEWSLVLGVALMREGEGGLQPLNALLAYLKDYRAPKGPLRISFAASPGRPDGLPLASLIYGGALAALGAKVTYAGAE